jgi:hypothetical protein
MLAHPRSTVHWAPASAGVTPVEMYAAHHNRHPREGGDPGHLDAKVRSQLEMAGCGNAQRAKQTHPAAPCTGLPPPRE